jgi:ElaB/YqjD/DUF883 family membrane-anchored ribosome-binding protein
MTTQIKKSDDDAEHTGSELADDAAEQLSALKAEVIKIVEDRFDALGKIIQQRPFMAVGIGFGLGYVIARLLHRDRQ